MENFENSKYKRAKKRVDELKGFYIHMTVYIVVNTFIIINIALRTDSFWHWANFITPVFWGIGLLFHASHAFRYNPFFGRDWEERQLRKFIEEDKKEIDKFK